MNGPHDMGGMQAFGAVRPDDDPAPFHTEWERRVFAINVALGALGRWPIDEGRFARESMDPAQYLASSYYQIWLAGIEALLRKHDLVSEEELQSGHAAGGHAPHPRRLQAEQVPAALARGNPSTRPSNLPSRFQVGQQVRTRAMNPVTHTRLPRYCRDKIGVIHLVHGVHVYPDTNAVGLGEAPQWLYTVRFDASALWGEDTTASDVMVDCWEPYLMDCDA